VNGAPCLPYNFRPDSFWDALPIEALAALLNSRSRIERWPSGPLLVRDEHSGKAAAFRLLTILLADPSFATTLDLNNTGDQTS
jgi:hypothetical protein